MQNYVNTVLSVDTSNQNFNVSVDFFLFFRKYSTVQGFLCDKIVSFFPAAGHLMDDPF
jgi:hypothetical protein